MTWEQGRVAQKQDAVAFIPIPVSALRADTVTNFNLYLPSPDGRAPVLYRDGAFSITTALLERLRAGKVETLLVKAVDEEAFRSYMESNLSSLVADEKVSLEERSALLYDSARTIVRDIIHDPRAGNVLQRSEKVVSQMVRFLYAEKEAFYNLMQVTSYDYYTYTHSVNVFVYNIALAARLGVREEHLHDFGQGGLLHDIGKSRITPEILNAPGKLKPHEWGIMKMHPVYGDQILLEQGCKSAIIIDIVRHHHEKVCGGGYPDNLSGDNLSAWARICAISDIFDALTTRRPYKDAMDSYHSLMLMKDEMLEQLDQDFFLAFVEMMGKVAKHPKRLGMA